jgi:hypothetical protein
MRMVKSPLSNGANQDAILNRTIPAVQAKRVDVAAQLML